MNQALVMERLQWLSRTGLGVPLLLLLVLGMLVIPLPAPVLDALFTFNITLSLIVILAVIYIGRPLDFGAFPTVLLGATILRLALNIASTRVVLLRGHASPDAAGKVIEAFGAVVIGGSYAVGLVVFAILVIINFVVVTRGAGRISEVSARFILDAMPGKQMAIDADLNAGLITQDEARARRSEVREEADFYGAMDGASKFVRGDAVAGILILFINIIGGLLIGTMSHGMSLADATQRYTLLTIGDGLVAQIPALLLSVAVAVLVTRVSRPQNMGEQVATQLLSEPRVLAVAAAILLALGLVPGMPHVVFLLLAGLCAGGAHLLSKRRQGEAARPAAPPAPAETVRDLSWDDVGTADPIGLEVGYRLIPLVDKDNGGALLGRIRGVRRKLSEELGFLVPAVHIRDDLELAPNAYRISMMGVPTAEAEVFPDRELAINPGHVTGTVPGTATRDPAFGLEALWIEPDARERAQTAGYTVVDAATVVATHLSQLLQAHAHELLGHEEAQQLLDRLGRTAPKLVEDLVPKALPLAVVVKVLQELLAEKIPLRNFRRIAETLAEQAPRSQDPTALLAAVRVALGRAIVQRIGGLRGELPVMTMDSALEQLLGDATQGAETVASVEPGLAERLHQSIAEAALRQETRGEPAVLLVAPRLRPWLARFTRHGIRNLHVLAYNEVPEDTRIRVVAAVGQNDAPAGRLPGPEQTGRRQIPAMQALR